MRSEQLKQTIIQLATESRNVSANIQKLAWKDKANDAINEIHTKRNSLNQRIIGKKSIKHLRKPDTGITRQNLWLHKKNIGYKSRYAFLAYAFLRGMPYNVVETKTTNKPSARIVYYALIESGIATTPEAVRLWLSGEPKVQEKTDTQ